jgi:hypothetical protein
VVDDAIVVVENTSSATWSTFGLVAASDGGAQRAMDEVSGPGDRGGAGAERGVHPGRDSWAA